MLADYEDITSRIGDPILWHDCHGVPRYDPFDPELSPNIYATEVLLFEIACQACGRKFQVEKNRSRQDLVEIVRDRLSKTLEQRIREREIHYGDPPSHGHCSGNTMNCIDLKVVQFWRKGPDRYPCDWVHIQELDGFEIEPEWSKNANQGV